eukprot:CAMPEP_0202917476 /NCGR_PEP_ID=MMETSP1392-20130828/71078_1 /ASSEMBLY_ACC=CAM_ASM_000868 /TAXON_ID=225041 /ORGANISM="Chlamydomonas chlamydogama, Strain SAG 11-48b" /LENGTH=124 /DNA_ID=CAMNT_0049610237 /DNA_START=394 /DNA_END=768 /DNA_ORIENTATION=-
MRNKGGRVDQVTILLRNGGLQLSTALVAWCAGAPAAAAPGPGQQAGQDARHLVPAAGGVPVTRPARGHARGHQGALHLRAGARDAVEQGVLSAQLQLQGAAAGAAGGHPADCHAGCQVGLSINV